MTAPLLINPIVTPVKTGIRRNRCCGCISRARSMPVFTGMIGNAPDDG
jgi:hypothetical protein